MFKNINIISIFIIFVYLLCYANTKVCYVKMPKADNPGNNPGTDNPGNNSGQPDNPGNNPGTDNPGNNSGQPAEPAACDTSLHAGCPCKTNDYDSCADCCDIAAYSDAFWDACEGACEEKFK